jgi:hypothetical protein
MMAERADAFLALPGGIGTFEEFFEAWSWRMLNFHQKPVALLDQDGYYRPLLQFLEQSVRHGFMNAAQMDLLTVGSEPARLLPQLVQAAGFDARPWTSRRSRGSMHHAAAVHRPHLSADGLDRAFVDLTGADAHDPFDVVTKILPSPILPVRRP